MITGELRSRIDAVWNDFWSGGISNPLEVMEQLTYLLFIKALDERQTLAENKANRTGQPIDEVIFPEGEDFLPDGLVSGRPYGDLRWSRFKHLPAADMFGVVEKYVFPFLHQRAEDSTHAKHMRASRRPRRRLLAVRGALRDRIATELRLGRSPVAIWSRRRGRAGSTLVETIYQAIYDGALYPSTVLSKIAAAAATATAAGQRGARCRRTSSRRPDAVDRREGGLGKATRSSAPTTGR